MRKIIITIAEVVFILTACSLTNDKMYIQKTELSKEEQSILNLVGLEKTPYILDYAIDDVTCSVKINMYELQGDKWKLIDGGSCQSLKDSRGRIALIFDNIGLGILTSIEGKGYNSYKAKNDFDFKGLSTTTSYLTEKTMIEYEKEIPLIIQIHTSKSIVSSLSPEYGFYELETYINSGYEKVYAITCMFSQKSVEQLIN